MRRPLRSTLFPYTTLFRSEGSDPLSPTTSCQYRRERAVAGGRGDWRPGRLLGAGGGARRRRCRRHPDRYCPRSEDTSELQSLTNLVCRLLLEKKKKQRG